MATKQRDMGGYEEEGFNWKLLGIVASVASVALIVGAFIGTQFDASTVTVSIPLPNLTPR